MLTLLLILLLSNDLTSRKDQSNYLPIVYVPIIVGILLKFPFIFQIKLLGFYLFTTGNGLR